MKKNNPFKILITISVVMLVVSIVSNLTSVLNPTKNFTSTEFMTQIEQCSITEVNIEPASGTYSLSGKYNEIINGKQPVEGEVVNTNACTLTEGQTVISKMFSTTVLSEEYQIKEVTSKLSEKGINYKIIPYKAPFDWFGILSTVVMVGFVGFMIFNMMKGKAPGTENKVMLIQKTNKTFNDVIGYDEEKKELSELVDFLKNPKKYNDMGASIPNGILLEGPPGTGKTLMAKAVAGEASVPFFAASGSDFEEMYVGLGASRVRGLFKEARKVAPAIIFIDEIDAIGSRDQGGPGGRGGTIDQTINSFLVEMDGFAKEEDPTKHVIVIAATNRSDKLDKALLRPGRLDRKVLIGLPEIKTRENILKFHTSKKVMGEDINYNSLARATSGMSGAQLEAVANEAAILAVRENEKCVTQDLLNESIDRVLMGPAKISNKYSEKDKKMVSYHESGHAIVGLDLEGAMEVQKITIIPRRDAGGYVSYIPSEDEERFITKKQLESRLISLLAGRASEEIFIGDITVGAFNDFEVATSIARSMVTKYGMSSLGTYQFEIGSTDNIYANKQYSDATADKIDAEINRILEVSLTKAKEILNRRKEDIHLLAETIREREVLDKEQIDYLMEHRALPIEEVVVKEDIIIESSKEKETIKEVKLDEIQRKTSDDTDMVV